VVVPLAGELYRFAAQSTAAAPTAMQIEKMTAGGTQVGLSSYVHLEPLPGSGFRLTALNGTSVLMRDKVAGAWTTTNPPPLGPVSSLRTLTFLDGDIPHTVFAASDGTTLKFTGEAAAGPWVVNSPAPFTDVDLAILGDNVVVVGIENGMVALGVVSRKTRQFTRLYADPVNPAVGWNGPTANASRPTVEVLDGEIGIAWQEGASGNYRMAGRFIF
jgi:hypothetical protein